MCLLDYKENKDDKKEDHGCSTNKGIYVMKLYILSYHLKLYSSVQQ